MEVDRNKVRRVVEEDRLSSLPDELLHKILSSFDMEFVVQTCLLSSRWKLLWTSMPYLDFSSAGDLRKFARFVKHVLTRRNHQIEVSSVKLCFSGAASQFFVKSIANYAFSHNVQELAIDCWPKNQRQLPPCLFSSQALKHFTLSSHRYSFSICITPKTPWDFPALTTLHLSEITLYDDKTRKSLDLFSKCVNLKNLTLRRFMVDGVKVFHIITPSLSNLTLIDGRCLKTVSVIAPQLENLTVIDCSIKYLIAPPGISSLCYRDYYPIQLCKERFHSLNQVTICFKYSSYPYKEEDARKTINLLQKLHSTRYLTLNLKIVECLSSFSDLISHHPSPFSNLICLTIDSSKREDAYKVKMSTEARDFLLGNSPNATFIMELPKEPPTKAMKQKEARAKKKAKQAAEIESHMKELQALTEKGNMLVERKEKAKAAFKNLMSQFKICLEEMQVLANEENTEAIAICSKKAQIISLLENLPKRERAGVEARYSGQLEEAEAQCACLVSKIVTSEDDFALEKLVSDCINKKFFD